MSALVEVFGRVALAVGLALVTWTYFLMTAKLDEAAWRRFVTLLLGWVLIVFSVWMVFQ